MFIFSLGLISTAQISTSSAAAATSTTTTTTPTTSGKRLIADKIADSLSRFRDIDTRHSQQQQQNEQQLGSDDDINTEDDEDDEDELEEDEELEEAGEQYATLSKIKVNSAASSGGLLKTTNLKQLGSNSATDATTSSNKEIWLEYGCI